LESHRSELRRGALLRPYGCPMIDGRRNSTTGG
jgi:hypothetical protein